MNADRMGFLAMMSPVAALALYALATVMIVAGISTSAFVLMASSLRVLLLSIPINAMVALLSRKTHRPRFVQALVGLVAGTILSLTLFAAMRVIHLKSEAVSQQLREGKGAD